MAAQAVREAKEAMMKLQPQLEGIPYKVLIRKADISKELSRIVDCPGNVRGHRLVSNHGQDCAGRGVFRYRGMV